MLPAMHARTTKRDVVTTYFSIAALAFAFNACVQQDHDGSDAPVQNDDGSLSVPVGWRSDVERYPSSAAQLWGLEKKAGWTSRVQLGPTISSKNVTHELTFPFLALAGITAGPLGAVRWTWGFIPSPPAELVVLLCRNGLTDCVDASYPGGTTNFWRGRATSNVPFYMLFRVVGDGTMSKIQGTPVLLEIENL